METTTPSIINYATPEQHKTVKDYVIMQDEMLTKRLMADVS